MDLELGHRQMDMKIRVRPFFAALLAAAALLVASPLAAHAGDNLVRNGLLERGSEGAPADWTSAAYEKKPGTTEFSWETDAAGIGYLSIDNRRPNDARWEQKIPVSPGTWYRVAGWVRTERVGSRTMGAYLSEMNTFHNTRDLRGSHRWTPVAMWIRTSALQTHLELAARIGGYSSINNGRAWFTGISVEAAGEPVEGTRFVYGGKPGADDEGGPVWTEVVGLLLLAGLVLLTWRYVARPDARVPR